MEFEVNHIEENTPVTVTTLIYSGDDCVKIAVNGGTILDQSILILKSELKEIFEKVFAEEEK